jgi:hypothetical protein
MREADPALATTNWWEGTLVSDMTSEQQALVERLVGENKLAIGKSGRVLVARKRAE